MGIFACLLFGIIGAWISRSVLAQPAINSFRAVLVIGLLGGIAGLSGIAIGWGDVKSFNLYNVLLSIAFAATFTFLFHKYQEKQTLPE